MNIINIKIIEPFNHIEVEYDNDRKIFTCDMDISNEDQQIKNIANTVWNDEIKLSWKNKLKEDYYRMYRQILEIK
jgi:predicted nucleotidyltransferase